MTAPASIERRLVALESEAFRTARHQQDIDSRLEFITGALGELSQGQRGLGVDVREIRTELAALTVKVDDLSTTVTDLSTTVTDLSTTVTDLSTTVTDLSTTVTDLANKVDQGFAALTELLRSR